MIRLILALMIGGGFLMYLGFNEMKLTSAAAAEPQTIAAADLIANGPGDNAHVIVTDFWLLDAEAVVEYPEGDEDTYNKVWAPVITGDDPYVAQYQTADPNLPLPPYQGDVSVILYSTDINNSREFMQLLGTESVQGLVINKIDKLGGEELEWLQKSLPTIDPEKVIMLEHNRKPASSGKVALFLGGGAVLFLVGPGLFFMGRRK